MGALVLSDALWQQLSAAQQMLVRETVRKYNAKAVTNMRQYETKALTLLQTTAGIETITVTEEEVARIQHIYKTGSAVELRFFSVPEYKKEIENRIFRDVQWVDRTKLPEYDFLDADLQLVRDLAAGKIL